MSSNKGTTLVPAGVALVVALGILAVFPSDTTMHRLANMDLSGSGFQDTYLMMSASGPDEVFVVDRADSTMRRADDNRPGSKWDAFRIPGRADTPELDVWLVQDKDIGKGTVFFVPVADVEDWIFPFLYGFVSAREPGLELPRVEWAQLYVNRVYEGLHLRVELPFDPRKRDGGSGILREVISIDGSRSAHVNSRFEDIPGQFQAMVTESQFPKLRVESEALAWLSRQTHVHDVTVLLSKVPPHDVTLLPTPVSLPELFLRLNGRPPQTYVDDRFGRWAEYEAPAEPPFYETELVELRSQFAVYAEWFAAALGTTAEAQQRADYYRAELPRRQAAGRELGLELEAF